MKTTRAMRFIITALITVALFNQGFANAQQRIPGAALTDPVGIKPTGKVIIPAVPSPPVLVLTNRQPAVQVPAQPTSVVGIPVGSSGDVVKQKESWSPRLGECANAIAKQVIAAEGKFSGRIRVTVSGDYYQGTLTDGSDEYVLTVYCDGAEKPSRLVIVSKSDAAGVTQQFRLCCDFNPKGEVAVTGECIGGETEKAAGTAKGGGFIDWTLPMFKRCLDRCLVLAEK